MAGPTVRLDFVTPTRSGERFQLERCIKWTVENQGPSVAYVGYPGQGFLMDLQPGTYREFEISWGHTFEDEMEVDFSGGTGKLLIIRYVTKNTEMI
jgi:hypothetical protein